MSRVRAVWFLVMGLVIMLLALLLGAVAHASVEQCIDATCRITTPDGSRGSGCVFEISQGQVYVLTAAHVVDKYSEVACEFWQQGHQSSPFRGVVVARVEQSDTDAAILAVESSQFGGRLPVVIPMASKGTVIKAGDTITSVGCANGAWSTGWKGHVLGYRNTDLMFTPAPMNGRSGSAVFDADGTHIVGLIRARTLDDSTGIATSLPVLYRNLGQATEQKSQCGPSGCSGSSGCPGGICPIRKPQPQPQPQVGPWPTLPIPAVPPVDLGPTNQRLDQIYMQIQAGQQRSPEPEPAKKEDGPMPAVIVGLFAAAVAVGGLVFFATQNHTG
jgi:hypothetical protein